MGQLLKKLAGQPQHCNAKCSLARLSEKDFVGNY